MNREMQISCVVQACYEVMVACWNRHPELRPRMDTLASTVADLFEAGAKTRDMAGFSRMAAKLHVAR
jgi:hypothetical protein